MGTREQDQSRATKSIAACRMAKALEALDGFNLFGNIASQAVIHVIHNDIAVLVLPCMDYFLVNRIKRDRFALLSIIGYPAYAVEDKDLVDLTREK
jgi:phosphorylase kinase alpha/beta subunit